MEQILIIQDSGELSALLRAHYASVRAGGLEDTRRAMVAQTFRAAVLDQEGGSEAEAILAALRDADPDVAVVLITAARVGAGSASADVHAWETLARPLNAEALRFAMRRAIEHTELVRENRTLRGQLVRREDAGGEVPQNGNGTHLHWITSLPPRLDLRGLLSSVEKSVIQRTLEATRGAQAEAARRLGLSRSDLSYKLAKYELRKTAERQL
jgi:DNA-binding NtrC family response regulator